ncbi:MAG: hypothetical protein ACRD36_01490 [Candidatus Acidiferrum sp.]
MVFAAFLLLCPLPQSGDKVSAAPVQLAAVSSISEKDSSLSRELPSPPQPKVKTDAANDDTAKFSDPNASSTTDSSVSPQPILPASPAIQPGSLKLATTHPYENPRDRKIWYALAFTGHSAAALDAWSTRRALSADQGTESNPLLRPFAHSGMLYAATQVSPLVMDYLGKRMMVSRRPWVRHVWWVPQTFGATMSFSAGVHNIGVVH